MTGRQVAARGARRAHLGIVAMLVSALGLACCAATGSLIGGVACGAIVLAAQATCMSGLRTALRPAAPASTTPTASAPNG